jgi:hypothetical protein
MLAAAVLDPGVEVRLGEQLVEPFVERVPGGLGEAVGGDEQ